MPRQLLALAAILAMLATAFEAGAADTCSAGNPNNSVAMSTPDGAFTDNGNGTVTHSLTGLMWKQAVQGPMSWSAALAAGAADTTAGHSDWRLPNKKELESIVETCGYSPSINQNVFPALPSPYFWSGSSYAPNPSLAWFVYFYDGGTHAGAKSLTTIYVRLVRGGQSFDSFDAQGDITAPVLSSVGVSGTTSTATTLAATSNEAATGYWIVVPQGSTAPTAAQVKAGVNYGVTLAASGNGAMTAATPQNFSVTGLTAATAYDLYVVAEDSSSNHNLTPATIKVQFTTTAAPVNGVCVPGQTLTSAPIDPNRCTTGNATVVTSGNTSYTWSCLGSNGGSDATNCSAIRNYLVTTSVSGGGGSIGANQTVAYNATPSITLTPDAGYISGPVSGTCGGALAGNSYTTNAVTASCTVVAGFTAATTVRTYAAPSATSTGNITASFTTTDGGASCGYTVNRYIPVSGGAGSPPAGTAPAGVIFPQGLFDFTASGCAVGSTLNFIITYPQALPAGTVYWKYGPTPGNATPHWYVLPAVIAGSTATFSITDGGLSDDGPADGSIVDQGGPGFGAASIPTLSEWALMLLAGLVGWFGLGAVRRRGV